MKKILLFVLIIVLSKVVSAQTYTLTRGLTIAEITGTETAIAGLGDDNNTVGLPIGFDFNFYGVAYSQFFVGSNGIISFGSGKVGPYGSTLPNSSVTNSICFANADLHCGRGTPTINYFTSGTAPNRVLVVNFKNVQHYQSNSNLTSVQIQLYEGAVGKIELHITNVSSGGYSRTIGIENSDASSSLTEVALNGSSSLNISNEMIRFVSTPVCSNLVTVTATSSTLCGSGSTSTLTSSISPSGSFTYKWYKNSTIIAGETATTYIATAPGTYYVLITGTVDNCTKQSSNTIITNPFTASLNTSSTSVCNTVSVNVNPAGSYTYEWYKDDILIAGQSNSTYIPPTAGTYKSKVTSGSCSIFTNNAVVLANTLSTILSPSSPTLCSNITIYANASYNPTNTFSWSGPNGFTSTLQSPTISSVVTANAGIYTVTVNFGCGDIKTATTAVTISPNTLTTSLSPNSPTSCSNFTLYSVASSTPSRTFAWSGPNSFSSTLQSPNINNAVAANAGIYSVTVNFGCGDIKTATTAVTISPNMVTASINPSNPKLCSTIGLVASANYTVSRTFSWSGPNSFTSSLQSPTISNAVAANAGIYTVTVNFGCGDIQTATTSVTIGANILDAYVTPNNPRLCSSFTLNATASYTPSSSFSWSGPNGFTSTSQYPTIDNAVITNAGIYTVTVNFGCGDIQTATTSVTLNPNTVSINSSNYSAFNCSSFMITPNVSSSPAGISYSWTGPNSFTSTSSNINVSNLTAANAGTYTLSVNFGASCGGISTATTSLTVNSNYISLNSSNYTGYNCGSLNLSPYVSSFPNGISYSWTGPNSFTSTSQNVNLSNLTAANSGIYSLSVNFGAGCGGVNTATTSITVIPNIVTLNPSYIGYSCGSLFMTPTISTYTSGISYSWSGPNGFTSTSQSASLSNLTASNAGTYTLTVDLGANCGGIKTATTSVTINPNIVTLNPSYSSFECGTKSISPNISTYTNGISYLWSGPNGFTSSSQNASINNLTSANGGVYTVSVNFGTSCGGVNTATTVLTVSPNTVTLNPTYSGYNCGSLNLSPNISTYTSGISYSWTGPNGFTSSSQNANISNLTNADAGVYTISVNFGAGCGGIKTATSSVSISTPLISAYSNASSSNCIGSSINLQCNNSNGLPATYSWSGPNGFTSNLQNPILVLGNSGGTYTVTVNFGSCGTTTATTAINVGVPIFTASSSTANFVCPTSSVDLNTLINNFSAYNIPSPTVTSYSWSGPDGFSSTLRSPTVTNLTTAKSGFYTVTISLTGGCSGTYTAVAAINVSLNPELGTGYSLPPNSFLCEGYPVTLTPTTNSLGNTSVSYSWSGPDGFSSSSSQPTLSPVGSGGVYTLTATFSGGCIGTHTSMIPIYVNKKPNLYLNSTLSSCLGGTLTLPYMSGNSNLTYEWIGPNSFSSNQSNPNVSTAATSIMSGIYTVTVTDATGGCPLPFTATTNVNLINCGCGLYASVSGNSVVCSGSTVYLSASTYPSSSANYSWSGPNGFSSSSAYSTVYNVTVSGVYTVSAVVSSGTCAGTYTSTTSIIINSSPPSPTLSLNTNSNYCEGGYFAINTSVNNGSLLRYTLSGPNSLVYYFSSSNATSSSNYFDLVNPTPTMSGTYTVNATIQGACNGPITQQTGNVVISVLSRPSPPTISVNPSTINLGESVTLNSSNCGSGNSLFWNTQSTVNTFVEMPVNNTAYWAVCRSNLGGCSSGSSNIANVVVISCQQLVNLVNPTNNYSSGTILKEAKASDGVLTATNLITGSANVTYQAKSIIMDPGFKADDGTVFKAEVGGCN